MAISNSRELLGKLFALGYDNPSRDPWWWPNSGTVETLVGAILTQNTQWSNVEKSLDNLRAFGVNTLEDIANIDTQTFQKLIRPSGFYRAKSSNLQQLSTNILETYGSFEHFCLVVDRDWLMEQKGVGDETADAILNYACYKEAMVVDSYTSRLLDALGFNLGGYAAVQEWMIEGIEDSYRKLFPDLSLAQMYARYHGMVVEYCKINKNGRVIDILPLTGD